MTDGVAFSAACWVMRVEGVDIHVAGADITGATVVGADMVGGAEVAGAIGRSPLRTCNGRSRSRSAGVGAGLGARLGVGFGARFKVGRFEVRFEV